MILQGDKDSSVIITDKSDKMQKLENMIKERINKALMNGRMALLSKISKDFKIFCTKKFTMTKTTTRCILIVTI